MTSLQISQYSLYTIENYKSCIINSITDILDKYNLLIIEYFKLNIKDIKNIRGLNTISQVFEIMLYYTKNLDMTYYHSQKAFYFYGEFINQIIDDPNYLQLSSKDATLFVYKKTIFDINLHIQQTSNLIIELDKHKLDILNIYIIILKTICEITVPNYIELIITHLNNPNFDKEIYDIILLFIQQVSKEEDIILLFIKILSNPFDKKILKKNIEKVYEVDNINSRQLLIDLFIE